MSEIEAAGAAPIVARPAARAPADYTDADFTITAETAERLLTSRPDNTRRAYGRNWD